MRHATLLLLLLCSGCGSYVDPNFSPVLRFLSVASATVGAARPIQVEVLHDQYGLVPLPTATDRITISIHNNPGGGTLSGATTVAAVNGVATFPNLSIDKQGEGYTLTAIAAGFADAFGPPFNVACTCWSSKPPMPSWREGLGVGVVNGILYAVGGDNGGVSLTTVEAYDPVANSWTTKAPMPTSRSNLSVGVVNGVLYAVGGGVPSLATTEAYDPVTNSWTTKAPMPTPRSHLAAGVVNGVLYAIGGQNIVLGTGVYSLGTVEAYDPVTNSWTTKAPMPTTRQDLAVGVVNGILYAVGGYNHNPNGGYQTTVEAYDPVTNSWTTKAPMPTSRYSLGVGVVNGVLYAIGGFDGRSLAYGYLATLEAYEPAANSWTRRGPMLTSRFGLGVGVVNGILYAVGGQAEYGNELGAGVVPLATLEAYYPAQDH